MKEKGLPKLHAIYIDQKHGSGTAEKLQQLARQPFRITNGELKSDIKEYRELIRFLKKEKGIL